MKLGGARLVEEGRSLRLVAAAPDKILTRAWLGLLATGWLLLAVASKEGWVFLGLGITGLTQAAVLANYVHERARRGLVHPLRESLQIDPPDAGGYREAARTILRVDGREVAESGRAVAVVAHVRATKKWPATHALYLVAGQAVVLACPGGDREDLQRAGDKLTSALAGQPHTVVRTVPESPAHGDMLAASTLALISPLLLYRYHADWRWLGVLALAAGFAIFAGWQLRRERVYARQLVRLLRGL